MRTTVIMLIALELLLRGAVVSHVHEHCGMEFPTENNHRPHVHLSGHVHPHGAADPKSHRHRAGHTKHHSSSLPPSNGSSETPSGHDHNVFYVSDVPVGVSESRVRIPDAEISVWLTPVTRSGCDSVKTELWSHSAAGILTARPGLNAVRLPHQLQV